MKRKKSIIFYIKVIFAILIIVCAFCLCTYRLMKIQIVNSQSYTERADVIYHYSQVLSATRGEIVDINGTPIIENKIGYNVIISPDMFPENNIEGNAILLEICNFLESISVEPEETLPISVEQPYTFTTEDEDTLNDLKSKLKLNVYATAENCIDRLIDTYDISPEYTPWQQRRIAGIRYEMMLRGFSMSNRFTLAKDIPLEAVTKIKENNMTLQGIDIAEEGIRSIAQGDIIPHEIGSVGPIYADEYEELAEQGYDLDDTVGKSGIERAMEKYLRGKDGVKSLSLIDGEVISTKIETPVESGNTIKLTVDSTFQKDLQKILENFIKNFDSLRDSRTTKLGKVTNGAIVVLDAKTAGVLGMATCPTYTLQEYDEDYEKLLKRDNDPLVNRATMGLYQPGSSFKTITATAGMNEGIVTGESTFYCGRDYQFKDVKFSCLGAHGDIALVDALKYSCNIYFYKMAEQLTIDRISKYATLYGLGQNTGIETGDLAGYIANPETYAKNDWEWTVGNVLQAAIGQANVAVTPLQMAVVANTIANEGVRYKPHLVDSIWDYNMEKCIEKIKPTVAATIDVINDSVYSYIESGMIAAANTNYPDKYSLSNLGYDVAVKTGTPQRGSNGEQDSFFIGYAPADDPQIAFAGVIEGGEYSKYMIRDLLKAYERYQSRAK